ncbi:MAG TPA: ATPase [bacterium]|nr:ATPase [bacterium]
MHVLFLAPETQAYYREFVRGLREVGARVTGLGHSPRETLAANLKPCLDGYVPVRNLFDDRETVEAARRIARSVPIDRVETTDETLVVAAARLRAALGLPGLTVEAAVLCRDKAAMKDHLRARGIACAQSIAARSGDEIRAFAEREGYPVIIKPRAGFGSLHTHRVESAGELERLVPTLSLGPDRAVAVEEFVEGHEGVFDTIWLDDDAGHDFVGHYYPGCLEATQDRRVAPQIVVTNRLDGETYRELRRVGREVNRALGITRGATHMEWFFGPKGLKFSEIGARPAGERIWDLYRVANDLDVYREWASAVVHGRTERPASRRYSTGAIQIRPDRDGRYLRHEGLDEIRRFCGPAIYEARIPAAGTPTQPVEKGWIVNTWFRLRHEDYDRLREMLDFIGRTVKVVAQPIR